MKKQILSLVLLLNGIVVFAQQLPYKNLFTETSFVWNPGMTGVWDYFEFGATYHQQWTEYNQSPETAQAFIQIPILKQKMSFGGSFLSDRAGLLDQNLTTITYAYRLRPNLSYHDQLSIGIGVSLHQLSLNTTDAIGKDLGDPLLFEDQLAAFAPNVSFGLFYATTSEDDYDKNFYFGGIALNQSLPNALSLNSNQESVTFDRVIHGNAILGARFISGITYFEPSIWLDYSAPNIFHTTARMKIDINDVFWGAVGYSTDHTLHGNVGVTIRGGILQDGALRVGATGRTRLGKMADLMGIGYEVYVSYRFYMDHILGRGN